MMSAVAGWRTYDDEDVPDGEDEEPDEDEEDEDDEAEDEPGWMVKTKRLVYLDFCPATSLYLASFLTSTGRITMPR